MKRRLFARLLATLFVAPSAFAATTLEVGPGKPFAAPCAAVAVAQPGDVITIDAAGTYSGDVCAISTDRITLRGVNGRPKIDAGGQIAQSKGTWVVYGNDITIENVELLGAHSANGSSPGDQNGAGIRGQGTNLTVRGCYIHDNDNGILGGGATDAVGDVTLEGNEFANNGFGDGYSHNVYISHVARLVFRFNYSHDVAEGHLLKSRADTNVIAYNRLTGEGGTDSYEVDLPNGGVAYVIGNVIQQGATSHNPSIVAFAEEGSHANGTPDHLFVVNNTIVNELGKGTFVLVGGAVTTPAVIANNIFSGTGTPCSQASAVLTGNFTDDPAFVSPSTFHYHLLPGSGCIDAGSAPGTGDGFDLTPVFQYVHPASSEARAAVGTLDIGAYEFGNAAGGAGQAGSGGDGGSTQAGGQGGSEAGQGGSDAGQGGIAQGGSSQAGSGGSAQAGGGQTGGSSGASGKGGAGGTSGTSGSGGTSGTPGSGGVSGTAGSGGKAAAGAAGQGSGGAPHGGSGGAVLAGSGGSSAAQPPSASSDDGGCGCKVAPPSPGAGAAGGLVGLAIVLFRRRRDPRVKNPSSR
jgi:MYXO-CTERM domain-containing protein